MKKNKLKELLNSIIAKWYAYRNNYGEFSEKEKILNSFIDSLPRVTSKFRPTAEDKYNMSPREIDEKTKEYETLKPKLLEERHKAIEIYKKEINYFDYYSDVIKEFDKLPNDLAWIRETVNDAEYGEYKISKIIELSEDMLFLLNLSE